MVGRVAAAAAVAVALLAGCDSRPTLESSTTAFSVGGLALGMARTEVEARHALRACEPAAQASAACQVDDATRRYTFFGLPVGAARVRLNPPASSVAEIRVSTLTGTVQKAGVEVAWALQGRCMAGEDLGGEPPPALAHAGLLPADRQDFICLGTERRFLQYTALGRDGAGTVAMFFLSPALDQEMGRLLESRKSPAIPRPGAG